jgi:thymidylate kinase
MSMLKFSYYTIDQWLSEVLWARTKLSYGDVVVLDRHLLELPIDPKRYRYAGSKPFARLLGHLAPKPDLMLVLDADPAITQSRKQDVPYEETVRQRKAYRDLADRTPQARIIDASQPLDLVLRDVRAAIAGSIAERTRKRFNLRPTPGSASAHASARTDVGDPVTTAGGAAQ